MKLLTEFVHFQDLKVLLEGENGKECRISGPFLQSEIKNKNGRTYSKTLCEREVKKFNEEKIKTNRALGELDHPPTPVVNLNRVSHKIESLVMNGTDAIGTAKIIDTPMGKIAQTLIREGVVLGVSSRGVGTIDKDSNVDNNYKLITIDLVADPSAPNSFVNGVLENKEFIMDGDEIVEVAINNLKSKMDKKPSSKEVLKVLNQFLEEIRNHK